MTQPRSDPYADLGIPRDATSDQVREAYRRLAKCYHPDLHPDAATDDRMQRINQAWHVLSSPIRRARFDAGNAAESGRPNRWTGSPPRAWSAAAGRTSRRAGQSPSARDIPAGLAPRFEPRQGANHGSSWSAGLVVIAVAWLVIVSAVVGFLPVPVFAIVLLLTARSAFGRRTDAQEI